MSYMQKPFAPGEAAWCYMRFRNGKNVWKQKY